LIDRSRSLVLDFQRIIKRPGFRGKKTGVTTTYEALSGGANARHILSKHSEFLAPMNILGATIESLLPDNPLSRFVSTLMLT
jgi:hypothetical protein